jgi:hypothetical protein
VKTTDLSQVTDKPYRVTGTLVFKCIILYCFFCPLYCIFDIAFMIVPLVSSSFSYHILLYRVNLTISVVQTHYFNGDRH